MLMRKFIVLSGTLLLVAAATSVEAANLITNGSFEMPPVPLTGFTDFPVGGPPGAIPGWTVVGPPGTGVSIVSGTASAGTFTFNAQDGIQWLDLTGNGVNKAEGVLQAVATTAGCVYQLSYYVGNNTTSTVNVLVNGIQTFTDTNSTSNSTTLNWQQFTHTFTALGSTTTLSFLNGDPMNDHLNGLDNVVVGDTCLVSTGRMTGGGSVFTTAGVRVTHGFELHCDATHNPNNLEVNWDKGNNFHLTSLTSAQCFDDPGITPNPPAARFDTYIGSGVGLCNGLPAAATWTFTDAGEPGRNDSATINITGGCSLPVSGNLQNGNQQAHSH